jgi:hypothetical protein
MFEDPTSAFAILSYLIATGISLLVLFWIIKEGVKAGTKELRDAIYDLKERGDTTSSE